MRLSPATLAILATLAIGSLELASAELPFPKRVDYFFWELKSLSQDLKLIKSEFADPFDSLTKSLVWHGLFAAYKQREVKIIEAARNRAKLNREDLHGAVYEAHLESYRDMLPYFVQATDLIAKDDKMSSLNETIIRAEKRLLERISDYEKNDPRTFVVTN